MSTLALVSILLGIIIIVTRGPLMFAPTITKRFYQALIESNLKMRITGVFTALLSIAMIISARGSDQNAAFIILIVGWAMAILAVFAIFFTSFSQSFLDTFIDLLDSMDNIMKRITGVFYTLLGAFFIYLGLIVF